MVELLSQLHWWIIYKHRLENCERLKDRQKEKQINRQINKWKPRQKHTYILPENPLVDTYMYIDRQIEIDKKKDK